MQYMSHSVTLMPLLDSMLKNAGLTAKDMSLIAVAAGPGSFTGLRIGVSAALDAQLGVELVDILLDAALGEIELFGDLPVGEPLGDQGGDSRSIMLCSAAVTACWSAGAPIAPWRWRYWRTS